MSPTTTNLSAGDLGVFACALGGEDGRTLFGDLRQVTGGGVAGRHV